MIVAQLQEAQKLLQSVHNPMAAPLPGDLESKLDFMLHKCGSKSASSEWKIKPALEPEGYDSFHRWAKQGPDHGDFWWIEGAPGSGRSSLAAAALKACCVRAGCNGLFVSVRTLSQELKDVYYDTRSYLNKDFMSERDRMEPLISASFLVLDDFDRVDSDTRVIRAFAQLLDYRYAEELPTLLIAGRSLEALQSAGGDIFPLAKLEDPNLMRRLSGSRRVVLQPILERLLKQAQHG